MMLLLLNQLAPLTIDVDARAKGVPYNRSFESCVGSDRAAIYLRPEHQKQLAFTHDQLGFERTRCHGIFNQEMGVVRKDGTYDWTKVDAYLDTLRHIGMRPFIETGFMPEPLASAKDTIFYYRGNTTPPKSYTAWADLLKAFVSHERSRYGNGEVRRWDFEIWNEPNLDGFWHGSQADYFHLYETSVRAIKSVDPTIRVGGPATAGGGWVPEFLAFCAKGKVPVDFVTIHHYGVGQGFLDENGNTGQVLDPNPQAIANNVANNLAQVRAGALPNLPLYVTEWGPSYSSRDPVHDSYLCAPYILEKLSQTRDMTSVMSYWTFSDLFEENGPPPSPFHGGFGLLNDQGLRKPAFFAYRFLHQMNGMSLPTPTPRVMVTRDRSTLRALAWDYTPPVKQSESNQLLFRRDLPAPDVRPLAFAFSGLRRGMHTVKITRVGYRSNDVFDAYRDLGLPKTLSPADLSKLQAASDGRAESTKTIQVMKDGTLKLEIKMRTNDVVFVEVSG